MNEEPQEWIETIHEVNPITVARLERVLVEMAEQARQPLRSGSCSLTLGSCHFHRDDKGAWTRETRRRNPVWLDGFSVGVIADAGATGCPCLVFRYSRREPWRKRIVPALRALCRAHHGKTLQADGIVLDGYEGEWNKAKRPRYEFSREIGTFQAVT